MRFDLDSVFGVHEKALKMRSQRAELISANIANADTPGYKARDIDFRKALAGEESMLKMNRTHSMHIPVNSQYDIGDHVKYRIPLHPSVDDNTVDMHIEQKEFSRNTVQYQSSFEFLNGKIKGIIRAIKGE